LRVAKLAKFSRCREQGRGNWTDREDGQNNCSEY
jgi:hypothetical protein